MSVKESWRRRVAEIEAVHSGRGRARHGTCALEGTRLFERALRLGVRIEHALVAAGFLEDRGPRNVALRESLAAAGVEIEIVPEDVLERLTEGRSLGGIIGLARVPEEPSLAQVLDRATSRPARLLACCGVDDPGNVGALVRTAHASGAAAFVAVGTCDAFHPKAVRTSMGSVFGVPILPRPDLRDLVSELALAGVRTIGAVSTSGTPLPELAPCVTPVAVFLGSEAFGLSAAEQEQLDELATIPMASGVDSLSVNAAAAVFLYALR